MQIKRVFQSATATIILITTGCASIVIHSDWPVTFNSNPSNAEIIISNKEGKEIQRGTTPATITLPSGNGYFSSQTYYVAVKLNGYTEQKGMLESRMNGWYVGNLLFGGLIGFLIVDPLTGAMYKLPHDYSVTLSKNNSPIAATSSSDLTNTVASTSEPQTTHPAQPTLTTIKVVNYQYDNATRKGTLSVDVSDYGLDARDWVLKNIGKICSSKNLLLEAGEESDTGGKYRVLNESMKDGILTIEFTAGYD